MIDWIKAWLGIRELEKQLERTRRWLQLVDSQLRELQEKLGEETNGE